MTFAEELKRRNVIRVGILYLVASWLLLQLTDVLASLLPVPTWAGSLVIMLLALGFFPVVIFAWVYEMTPEGLKREKDVDRSQSITGQTGHRINILIAVLLVLAIGGLAADRLVPDTAEDVTPAADAVAGENSIAVLPFTDLSEEQDQRYFTDGLTEELLNLLVRVDGLNVASRTSSFAYRDSSLGVPEISRALKVDHILEGSVRKSGDRIRITAQLIESSTDRHLWSENFDRKLVDIFAIQDEIANAIVSALAGTFDMGGSKAVNVEVATTNSDAYELYLEARGLFIQRIRLDDSIRLFRQAIALDPNFVRAWEGLAAAEVIANDWIFDDGIDHAPLAREAADQALSLDPGRSMPLAVLGLLALDVDEDVTAGAKYFAAALERDPKNTSAWLWQGIMLDHAGFTDEAIASFEECLAIDPGYQNCRQIMATAYLSKGDTETAFQLFEQTLEHSFHSVDDAFVAPYVLSGKRSLALLLADARLGYDNAPVIEWIHALEHPDADNRAGFIRLQDWARNTQAGVDLSYAPHAYLAFRAYDELLESGAAGWASWQPDAREFRSTPQFRQHIRDAGVLAYWQARGFPPQCQPVGDDGFECD